MSNIPLTPDQRLLIISLAEPTLRDPAGGVQIPPSRQAAARLGWPITKLNRKLDNVCDKLTKAGVDALHGSPGHLAVKSQSLDAASVIDGGHAPQSNSGDTLTAELGAQLGAQ